MLCICPFLDFFAVELKNCGTAAVVLITGLATRINYVLFLIEDNSVFGVSRYFLRSAVQEKFTGRIYARTAEASVAKLAELNAEVGKVFDIKKISFLNSTLL